MSTFELLKRLSFLVFNSQNDEWILDDQRNISDDNERNIYYLEKYSINNDADVTNCITSSRLRRAVIWRGLDAFYNSHLWQEHYRIVNKRHEHTNECDINGSTPNKLNIEYYSELTRAELEQMCTQTVNCVAETSMTYALVLEVLFAQLLSEKHTKHGNETHIEEHAEKVQELSIAQKVLYVILETCSLSSPFSKARFNNKNTEKNSVKEKNCNKQISINDDNDDNAEEEAVSLIDITNSSTFPFSKTKTSTKHFSLKRQRFQIPVWEEGNNMLTAYSCINKVKRYKSSNCRSININHKKNRICSHEIRLTPAVMLLIESSEYLQKQLCWSEEENILVKNMWHVHVDQNLIAHDKLLPLMQPSLTERKKCKSSWKLESYMSTADSSRKINKLQSDNIMEIRSPYEKLSTSKMTNYSYLSSRELRVSSYTSNVLRKQILMNRLSQNSITNRRNSEDYRHFEQQCEEEDSTKNHFDFNELIKCKGNNFNEMVKNSNHNTRNKHIAVSTSDKNDDTKCIESLFVDSDNDVNYDHNVDDDDDDDDNYRSKKCEYATNKQPCLEYMPMNDSTQEIRKDALMKKQSKSSHQENLEMPANLEWRGRKRKAAIPPPPLTTTTTTTSARKVKVLKPTPMAFAFFNYTIPEEVCTSLYIAMHHCIFGTPDPFHFTERYEQNLVNCEQMERNEELTMTSIYERLFMRCPQIRLKAKFMRCFRFRCIGEHDINNNELDEDRSKTQSISIERRLPTNGLSALMYQACECGSLYLRLEQLCKLANGVEETKNEEFQNKSDNNASQKVQVSNCENVKDADKKEKCIGAITKAALESLHIGLRELQLNILLERDGCNANNAENLLSKQHKCGSHLHGYTCKELLSFWYERIRLLYRQLQQVAFVFYLCDDSEELDYVCRACENESTNNQAYHTTPNEICINSLEELLTSPKRLLERLHELHKVNMMNQRHLTTNTSITQCEGNILHQIYNIESTKSSECASTCGNSDISTTNVISKTNHVRKKFNLFEYIYECSFKPFHAMIMQWLRTGHVHDPSNEFFISMIKKPAAEGNSLKSMQEIKQVPLLLSVEQGVSSTNKQHTSIKQNRYVRLQRNQLEREEWSWVVLSDKIPHFISEETAYALLDAGNTARILYTALRAVVHHCEIQRQVLKGKSNTSEFEKNQEMTEESKKDKEMQQIICIAQLLLKCLTHKSLKQTRSTNEVDAKNEHIIHNVKTFQMGNCEFGSEEMKFLEPVVHMDVHNSTVAEEENFFTSCMTAVKQYIQLNETANFEESDKTMFLPENKCHASRNESPLHTLQKALLADLNAEEINVSLARSSTAKCSFERKLHAEEHTNELQDNCINEERENEKLEEKKNQLECKNSNLESPLEVAQSEELSTQPNDKEVGNSGDINDNNAQDNEIKDDQSNMYQLADINDEQFHMKRVGPSTLHIKAEADRTSALATFHKNKLLWEKCDVTSPNYWQYCSFIARRTLQEQNMQCEKKTDKVCSDKIDEERNTITENEIADYELYKELIGDRLSENWSSDILGSKSVNNSGESVKSIVWHDVNDVNNNEMCKETQSFGNNAKDVAENNKNIHKQCNTQTQFYDYKKHLPLCNGDAINMQLCNRVPSPEQYYYTLTVCCRRFYTHRALQFVLLPQIGELHQLYTKILDVCLLQNSRYASILTSQTWYEEIVHLMEVELDKILQNVECSFSTKNDKIKQSKWAAFKAELKHEDIVEKESGDSSSSYLLMVFNKLFTRMWSEAAELNSINDKFTTVWWEAEHINAELSKPSQFRGHYQQADIETKQRQFEHWEQKEYENDHLRWHRQRHVQATPWSTRESAKLRSSEVKRINDVWHFILSMELHTSFHSPVLEAMPFLPRAMSRYGHVFRTLVFWSTVNIVFTEHWRTIIQTNVREVFFFHSMTYHIMRQLQYFVWSNLCTLSQCFRESISLNSKQLYAFNTLTQFGEYHELFLQLCELTCFLSSEEHTENNESCCKEHEWQKQQQEQQQALRQRQKALFDIWENIHNMLASVHAVHDAVHTSKCAISVLEEKYLLAEKELELKARILQSFELEQYNQEHQNRSHYSLEEEGEKAIESEIKQPKQSKMEQKKRQKLYEKSENKEVEQNKVIDKHSANLITIAHDKIDNYRITAQNKTIEERELTEQTNTAAENLRLCCSTMKSESVADQTSAVKSMKNNRKKGKEYKKSTRKCKRQEHKLCKDELMILNNDHTENKSTHTTLLKKDEVASVAELQEEILTLQQEITSAKNALVEVRKAQGRYVHDTVTWHIRAFATNTHLLSCNIARLVEHYDNLLRNSTVRQSFSTLIALLDETADAMDVKWEKAEKTKSTFLTLFK